MIPLHRVLLSPPDGVLVDHIDGDGLNCRRSNLRLATATENVRNQRLNRRSTSGRKGVSWDNGKRKWLAAIMVERRRIRLGHFSDIEAAAAAYAEAARKHHGEFANLGQAEAKS